MHAGQAGGLDGTAARHKLSKMEFAIVEGQRRQWRDNLRNSITVAFMRDERHKRLLLWFRSVDHDLQLTEGIIGQAKSTYSSTALGLAEASMLLLQSCCTPGEACPPPALRTPTHMVVAPILWVLGRVHSLSL